jgi:TonB-dependent SusC/RagA subfamily outer membrane receptor
MSVRAKRFLVALATGALFAAPLGAQGTDARVTGRITDPAGAPIPGASVLVRELAAGASTSENGTYTLTIAASRLTGRPVTIIARAIGFAPVTRTITIAAGTNSQDFQLARDPLRLDAVVVTGVAEATESRRLGFAVGKVDEAQLKEVPAMNPVMALAGKVSGARVASGSGIPGAETSIRLRSATSITPGANNAPLVVVDGIITKGGLSDINSQDIESIEILKGPASAGIYGSDAAAGVINVITRRGRNAPEGKTVVTLRNEYGTSSMDRRLPLNQSTNCKARVTNANGVQDFPRDAQGRVTCPAADISIFYDQPYPAAAPFRDQQDAIIGNGEFYTNYLSVARRSGNTNFQASFENLHNGGIIDVPGISLDGLNRRNVRLNVDQFVRDNLDLSVGAFYTSGTNQTIGQGAGSTFFSILFMPPDVDLFAPNANGEPFRVDAGRLGATVSSDANPLYDLYSTKNTERRSRVQGSFRSRYRPTDWLSFDANYGYDRTTDDAQTYRPKNFLNS